MQYAEEEIKPPEIWLKDIKGECDGGRLKALSLHNSFDSDFQWSPLLSRCFHSVPQSWTPFSFFSDGRFSQRQKECVCRQLSRGPLGFDVSRAVPTCPAPLCQEITAPSLRSPTGCWEKRCPFDVLKKDLQCSLSSLLFCLWFIQTFSQVRSDSVPQFQNKQRSAAINGGMRAKANIDDVLENVTAAVKISNSVIIVTIWVVNLHFFVASARSVGCDSGRCFLFYCLKLLWFTFTAQISTHSFQTQQAGVWVRKLCQTQFAPPTHYRAAEWS